MHRALYRIALLTLGLTVGSAQEPAHSWKLHFNPDNPGSGFAVEVPEGNYRVTVTVGDPRAASDTTIKAELRRLMVDRLHAGAGEVLQRTFIVNVRTPAIAGGGTVRLKDREKTTEQADWDQRLSLELLGAHPALASVEIVPAPEVPTLFIAGDSTVADQPLEPYASWGQMITRFFGPGIAVANHSESGESLTSFIAENRLAKIMSIVRPGDYLIVQMGHNDQTLRGEGVGPRTSYKNQLKRFIAEARQHGATPILVTPMNRRTFDDAGAITNSLGEFPDAVRETAREEKVALIDLDTLSKTFYEALGPEPSLRAFAPRDGTHHNNYGAYELARCVVESIRVQKLPLARYLAPDTTAFDPAHPDPLQAFDLPASAARSVAKPAVVLIGDSTVRNGQGNGSNGQWGWGEPLKEMLAPLPVFNVARGGRSSRTFLTGGDWERALAVLHPGDLLLMQFGHNDGGPLDDKLRARGTLPGIGPETREIDNPITGVREVVHTYGWYLRNYIQAAKALGAKPVVCSPVPRKIWKDGEIERSRYARWAAEVAAAENVPFLELESLIAARYEALGPEKVEALFADEHTHTTRAGAELNAGIVAAQIKTLLDRPEEKK